MRRRPGPAWTRVFFRGPDVDHIRRDLREAYERDRARGVAPLRARARHLRNAAASAAATWRAHWRPEWPVVSWLDVKLGWRMVWKYPLLTTVSLASLAVGIPLGLAPAHVAEAIDAELPVPQGERVRVLRYQQADGRGPLMGPYDFLVWQGALTSFESLAAVQLAEHALDPGSGGAAPVRAAHVTGLAFSVLRTSPLLGRGLQPEDVAPGASPVVVLGHQVWQARFSGDPDVLDRLVRIGGVPHTVVGVMPDGFAFPMNEEVWLPLRLDPSAQPGDGPYIATFGRLAAGVSQAEARAEVAAVDGRLRATDPERYDRLTTEVVSVAALAVGFPREGLRSMVAFRLFDLIGLVLLAIACANVGILVFARTANRTADMTVRAALGASRARIVSQVCTEAFVLALLAAGAGLLLIQLAGDWLVRAFWSPTMAPLPWWVDLGVTPATAVRAVALAVLAALLSALVPALRITGRHGLRGVRETGGGATGLRAGLVHSVLIATQVAVAVGALGLLVAAGGRIADLEGERRVGGVDTSHYLAARLSLPREATLAPGRLPWPAAIRDPGAALQREIVAALGTEPGVRAVAVASHLPRMQHSRARFEIEGLATDDTVVTRSVYSVQVASGFFEAFHAPVLSGRGFGAVDLEEGSNTVLVNASFGRRVLFGANPVGRRVRPVNGAGEANGPWWEVVGVVPDLGVNTFEPLASEAIYRPGIPGRGGQFWVAVDVGSDPAAFAPRMRELVAAVNATALVHEVRPLDAFYPDDRYMILATAAGLVFLVLALLTMSGSGIYAILSFSVAQRTREIGVRTALGARRVDVVRAVGTRAALQLGAGVLGGILLARWLYLFVHADAATAMGTAWMASALPGLGVLLVVGIAACTGPLVRALRITPNEALRES